MDERQRATPGRPVAPAPALDHGRPHPVDGIDQIGPDPVDALGRGVRQPAASFTRFYHEQYRPLTVLARALVGPEQAEDVVQESLLVAYRRWRSIEAMHSPGGYVRGICVHQATSLLRRRRVERRALGLLGIRSDNATAEDDIADDDHEFWSQLRMLPVRQAQVAALHYALDMSVAEIAAVLGCSDGTVKTHLHRGRRALAAAMGLSEEES